MDCKVILNINGIETTSSVKLGDGFDKNDAIIQIKKNLSQLVNDQTIDTENQNPFYNAAVSIYRDIKRKLDSSKKDQKSNLESKVFDSIYDVDEQYLSNEFKNILKQFSSDFPNLGISQPKVILNITKQSIRNIPPNYNATDNIIYINLGQNESPSIIIEPLIHEYVHYILDSRLDLSESDISNIYNDISSILNSKKAITRSGKIENVHTKVKEYLAEAFTEQIISGYKLEQNQKINLQETLNKLNQSITSSDEILFFKFIADQEFLSEEVDDRSIVSAVKYSKGVDSEKVQNALKTVYDRFNDNRLDYGNDTKTKKRYQYDATFDEFQNSDEYQHEEFQLQLGRLETHDVVYVKSEDEKYKNKYYPIVYSYFDNKTDKQKFVTAVHKKDGTYTLQTFSEDLILGYRKSVGRLKFKEVDQSELDEISEEFKQDLVFSKTSNEKIDGVENGQMITIHIGKGKSKINKQAIEIRIGDNELANKDLLKSIKRNSIVSYKIKDKTKTSIIHAPVVRALANGVELYSANKNKVYFIPFEQIESVIVLKDDLIEATNEEFVNDNAIFAEYYKSKKIRYTTFKFTDKTGNFKSTEKSKYDYNQVYGDVKDRRKELDDFLSEQYKAYNKTDRSITFDQFVKENTSNTKQSKLAEIYFNRKSLIESFSDDNIYVVYDYVGNDKKTYSGKGKVIYSSKDMIYVYTNYVNKETEEIIDFVHKINIRDNVAKEYKPTLRRVLYDNKSEYNLIEEFAKHKQSIKNNYELMSNLGSDTNKSVLANKINKIAESQTSSFIGNVKVPKNLYDYFYYEYLTDYSPRKKAFYLSQINRGDIVFYNETGQDGKVYTKSSMVVGLNPATGAIIIGDIISNAKGEKAYLNQTYIKKELNIDSVQHIGYNIYDNKELGIKANKKMLNKYESLSKKLEDFNGVDTTEKKETMEKRISKWKNKDNLKIVDLYSIRNKELNRVFYVKESSLDKFKDTDKYEVSNSVVRYGLEVIWSGGSFLKRNKDKMYNINPSEKAYSLLEVGDVLTIGKNSGHYYDMIITDKIIGKDSTKYKIESFYIDENKIKKNITRIIDNKIIKDTHQFHFDKFNESRIKDNSDIFAYENKTYKAPEINKKQDDFEMPFSKQTSGFNKSYDSFVKVKSFSDILEKLYNVKFKMLTSNEIAEIYNTDSRNLSNSRAFVIGNEIVINSDLSSMAEPIHELTHMILPILKQENILEYRELISSIISHPDFDNIAKSYPNLSGDKLNEEVFCTIFGEYYAKIVRTQEGQTWNQNNKNWFQKIIEKLKGFFKNIFGIDDTEFDDLNDNVLMNMSIDNIMDKFGQNLLNGKYTQMIPIYYSSVDNRVEELFSKMMTEQKILKECYE